MLEAMPDSPALDCLPCLTPTHHLYNFKCLDCVRRWHQRMAEPHKSRWHTKMISLYGGEEVTRRIS